MGTQSPHSNNGVIPCHLSIACTLRHWGTFEESTVNGLILYVPSIPYSNSKPLTTPFVREWFPSPWLQIHSAGNTNTGEIHLASTWVLVDIRNTVQQNVFNRSAYWHDIYSQQTMKFLIGISSAVQQNILNRTVCWIAIDLWMVKQNMFELRTVFHLVYHQPLGFVRVFNWAPIKRDYALRHKLIKQTSYRFFPGPLDTVVLAGADRPGIGAPGYLFEFAQVATYYNVLHYITRSSHKG
jgi:hypothetical protein